MQGALPVGPSPHPESSLDPTAARRIAELAHDARNLAAALYLYCEVMDEPGVLAPASRSYGAELRLLAAASGRLVDQLTALERRYGGLQDVDHGPSALQNPEHQPEHGTGRA